MEVLQQPASLSKVAKITVKASGSEICVQQKYARPDL
jgi:hypothetical protein